MIDERTTERARAARNILENPDFTYLMAEIEKDIFDAFKQVKMGDTETLNNIHTVAHGHQLLKNKIAKYLETYRFEQTETTE